ncbi:hypothetical protein ACQP3L_39200, partial [Escherichia coli]
QHQKHYGGMFTPPCTEQCIFAVLFFPLNPIPYFTCGLQFLDVNHYYLQIFFFTSNFYIVPSGEKFFLKCLKTPGQVR